VRVKRHPKLPEQSGRPPPLGGRRQDDFDAANTLSAVPGTQGDNQMKKLNKASFSRLKKLALDREVVRVLRDEQFGRVNGGGFTGPGNGTLCCDTNSCGGSRTCPLPD
jgi:hypothetical protein